MESTFFFVTCGKKVKISTSAQDVSKKSVVICFSQAKSEIIQDFIRHFLMLWYHHVRWWGRNE